MVSPVTIFQPLPKAKPLSQVKAAVEEGQLPSYSANEALVAVEPLSVLVILFARRIIDCDVAVNEYHTSSLFSVMVQAAGPLAEAVDPVVLTVIAFVHAVPNVFIINGKAPLHSSFTGGAGVSWMHRLMLP